MGAGRSLKPQSSVALGVQAVAPLVYDAHSVPPTVGEQHGPYSGRYCFASNAIESAVSTENSQWTPSNPERQLHLYSPPGPLASHVPALHKLVGDCTRCCQYTPAARPQSSVDVTVHDTTTPLELVVDTESKYGPTGQHTYSANVQLLETANHDGARTPLVLGYMLY